MSSPPSTAGWRTRSVPTATSRHGRCDVGGELQVPQPQARVVGRALQHAEDRGLSRAVGPARRLCHRVGHRRHRKRARHGPDRTATQECRSRGDSRRWACPIRASASSNASKCSRPAITTSPSRSSAARGVAVGFWFNIGEQSSATVNLNEDGTATVITGSPDIGGSRASTALMAAEELGIVYSITCRR